jgi:hypothetical protein
MPAPLGDVFALMVLLVMIGEEYSKQLIPPPQLEAVFSDMVLLVIFGKE